MVTRVAFAHGGVSERRASIGHRVVNLDRVVGEFSVWELVARAQLHLGKPGF